MSPHIWPPPDAATHLFRPRRRRAADIDVQQWLRMAVMFILVLAVVIAVAGGFKAMFLL